jgi:hypothetical protein
MIQLSQFYEAKNFILNSALLSTALLIVQVALFRKYDKVIRAATVASILHYIVRFVIKKKPIWTNFVLFFYSGNDFSVNELIYLFWFLIRRYDLAGIYLAYTLRSNPLILFSLFPVVLLFKGEVKLIKFFFGFSIGLIIFRPTFSIFDKTFFYSAIIWALVLMERFHRWKFTRNDSRIEYREKMAAILIDSLLLPQITMPHTNWKVLALLATLMGQLTTPFFYLVLYLVCIPPIDPAYTFITTIGLILLYKGHNYERESKYEKWDRACAQLKLYQKANQGFDYELPPGIEDPQK